MVHSAEHMAQSGRLFLDMRGRNSYRRDSAGMEHAKGTCAFGADRRRTYGK